MANAQKVEALLKLHDLSDDQLHTVMNRLIEEFDLGLGRDTHPTATVKMLPTYVTALPDGTENGRVLALDLGGSNFRVLLVNFKDGKPTVEAIRKYEIPDDVLSGPGNQLFDFIADHVKTFTTEGPCIEENWHDLPLGFTFSFPCIHRGIASAELVKWTKGFSAPDVVGEDVVVLMNEALKRNDVHARVVALMNDTVGIQLAGEVLDRNCQIGFIVGTGINSAYVEHIEKVETFEGKTDSEIVVIDTEMGAFGDDGCLDEFRTKFDRDLDRRTPNVGTQLYEKCVSGMYLGEVVRMLLVNLAEEGVLFDGKLPSNLKQEWKLPTKFLSAIESNDSLDVESFNQVLTKYLGVTNASLTDHEIVRKVVMAVRTRSARLTAAGMAAIIGRIDHAEITLAMDGSLFKMYSKYQECVLETLGRLVTDQKYKIVLPEDGSGIGAAVTAALADRCHQWGV